MLVLSSYQCHPKERRIQTSGRRGFMIKCLSGSLFQALPFLLKDHKAYRGQVYEVLFYFVVMYKHCLKR